MKMPRRFPWFACVCLLSACAGDELSVGDVRCIGDGVECNRPKQVPQAQRGPLQTVDLPTAEATLDWQVDPPCAKDECAPSDSTLLVHADGSITFALTRRTKPRDTLEINLWVGRYDADGTLLGEHWFTGSGSDQIQSMALAVGEDDKAVLAVQTGDDTTHRLSLYELSDSLKPKRLFRTEGLYWFREIAVDRTDVLVAGYYGSPAPDVVPSPELTRFRRDGTLVWRQSSLRAHSDADILLDQESLPNDKAMPLVVDKHGRAIATVSEYRGSSVVAVGRDGNVAWDASTSNVEDRGEFGAVPDLVIDSKNRPLLAGQFQTVTGGADAYAVERFDVPADSPRLLDIHVAFPKKTTYFLPFVLGFAVDERDRPLVAATKNVGSNEDEDFHFVIERVSEDLTQRESFRVPGLDYQPGLSGLNEFGGHIVQGIRAGKDGTVYFWRGDRLGRITLPEPTGASQSDTK